jgi:hypothetical protein
MENTMKNLTVVAIAVIALMTAGPSLTAAGRPEPQSAQQQAMERLRQQQERMQEMERQRQEQQERQQEMERQRQEQQERQQEMERQRQAQQEQQQERQREQEQERQRAQEQQRQQAQRSVEPENRSQFVPHNTPENSPSNNVHPERRPNLGANHPNTSVLRPAAITPVMRHAMTYNSRPGGIHINPTYFATHFGREHRLHFTNSAGGPCIYACELRLFGGEWYFNGNGGWFGLMGPLPGNWGFQTDYLYIDVGDDGNYYLYDAQFPDVAVQLTFVQNLGDDQAGADQDQGDQAGQ